VAGDDTLGPFKCPQPAGGDHPDRQASLFFVWKALLKIRSTQNGRQPAPTKGGSPELDLGQASRTLHPSARH
jgi:hypothetical protein